jgi:predicted transcriptional regulator
MCRVLLSINPPFVRSILDGTKRYEYRRVRCSKEIDGMMIYCTSPVCKIVAEAEVTDVITGDPEEVWRITHEASGISKEFFDRYYGGRDEAVAYAIGRVHEFPEPKDLSEYGVSRAPQSFVYLEE